MIQIYSPGNEDFDKNGDITLFPDSCYFTAELGGGWILEMEHPRDEKERWKYICEEATISAPTWEGRQLFRVDKCEKTDTNVSVVAYPIFFDSADDCFLMDVRPTEKNGQEALDIMMNGSKYSGESDITTEGTAYFIRRNLMDAINGENSPTFIEVWGGEILFDNRKVIIKERVGEDNGVEIRYGKNMDGISYTVDMSDMVTRIVPVAFNGRTMSGKGYVDSGNLKKYTKVYTREVKFEDVKLAVDVEGEDEEAIICKDQKELDTELLRKCEDMYSEGADLPAVTIETNMILLANTEQYKDFALLETVGLGDTVQCINRDLDLHIPLRVISLTWDCIQEIPTEVKIGDKEYSYFSDVSSTMQAVGEIIGPENTVRAGKVQGIIDGVKAQLRAQSSAAEKQEVRAVLFEDLDPESQTFGAMCLGTMGFQIASERTEDERDWKWTTFGTGQGFFADFIVAGTMLADRIKGGTLILGGKDNGDGMAKVIDANGKEIVRLDNTGVYAMGSYVCASPSDRRIEMKDGTITFSRRDKSDPFYMEYGAKCLSIRSEPTAEGLASKSLMRIFRDAIYFDTEKVGPGGTAGKTGKAEFSDGTYLTFKNGFLTGGNTSQGSF